MFGVEPEYIDVNGVEICFVQAGTKHEQSMVMVHGLGYSKESMLPLFEHYKHRYHVVSYDTRGSGESSKPDAWTLDDDADDLEALAQALGLDHPVGIGFSMGSFVVMRAAENYPDLFSKIVLIGTSGKDPASYFKKPDESASESNAQAAQQEVAAAKGQTEKQFATNDQLMKKIKGSTESPKGPAEKLLDSVKVAEKMVKGHEKHPLQATELIERTRPSVELTTRQFEALEHSLDGFDNLKKAGDVSIPVLCLTGEHDRANPPERGRALAEAVKNGRFYEIPQAGHIAIYENLPDVLKHIDKFLRDND